MTATSYCVECDALPGECDHRGARYLDPIAYERVEGSWKVPDGERWRVDHPPRTWDRLDPRELDYGAAREEEFPPVTTENGEEMRQVGLRLLGDRYRVLFERAKRRVLTITERRELGELERVIGQLEGMAPLGRLQPRQTGDPFA